MTDIVLILCYILPLGIKTNGGEELIRNKCRSNTNAC